MTNHPTTGGALRLPEPSRTLIATEDGLYLWPGILLVRKGCAIERSWAYEQLARLYGPSQNLETKLYALEAAGNLLLRADISAVQHQLDLLDFPPVSPNGALLMNAIAKRQRLPVPKVQATYHQSGTRWDAAFAAQIAPLFDGLSADAKVLAKRFAPDIGKEWHFNPDQPRDDHGRWSGSSSDNEPNQDSSDTSGNGSTDTVVNVGTGNVTTDSTAGPSNISTPDALVAAQDQGATSSGNVGNASIATNGTPASASSPSADAQNTPPDNSQTQNSTTLPASTLQPAVAPPPGVTPSPTTQALIDGFNQAAANPDLPSGSVQVAGGIGATGTQSDATSSANTNWSQATPATLPNGETIPDANPKSATGIIMTPSSAPDLSIVAAAGRLAGNDSLEMLINGDFGGAEEALLTNLGLNVGTGGVYDYQRQGDPFSGFTQYPEYRPIADINVGLFSQQAGLTLNETLSVAGAYASHFSSNASAQNPYGLNPATAGYISQGYQIGERGVFGPPSQLGTFFSQVRGK